MRRYDKNGPLAMGFNLIFLVFILAPLVVVCLVAFTDKGYLSLPRDGLSLRWFIEILDHPEFIDAFWYSIYLAIGSATLAVMDAGGTGGDCHRAL
jgi:putative spermidine/putrescine transport system permease protein